MAFGWFVDGLLVLTESLSPDGLTPFLRHLCWGLATRRRFLSRWRLLNWSRRDNIKRYFTWNRWLKCLKCIFKFQKIDCYLRWENCFKNGLDLKLWFWRFFKHTVCPIYMKTLSFEPTCRHFRAETVVGTLGNVLWTIGFWPWFYPNPPGLARIKIFSSTASRTCHQKNDSLFFIFSGRFW